MSASTKPFAALHDEFDAVLFAGGAEDPRDPQLPGQDLDGVHFAMPYLTQSNKRVGGEARRLRASRSWPPASTWW